MNKLRLRTKIETILVTFLLLSIAAATVLSLTRTISDTHDDMDTFIRNSKGNYWEATGDNIQIAIDDLSSTNGGTVWVGSDVTLYSTIYMNDKVQLDFQNNKVTLGNNIEFVIFTECQWASVKNAYVTPSTYHTKSIIVVYCDPSSGWDEHCRHNTVENIRIVESSAYTRQHNWTGIHLKMDGDSDIALNTFRDVSMYGCRNGILLESNHNGAWANGNYFENIWISRFINGVWFDDIDGNSFNANVFTNVKLQTIDGDGSEGGQPTGYTEPMYGFRNICGNANHFDHCLVWDWYVADDPQYAWWIGPDAKYTEIDDHASGKWNYEYTLDEGTETTLTMGGYVFPRIVVQDWQPNTMPNNSSVIWIDSNDNDRTYLVFNWNGDLRKVELT